MGEIIKFPSSEEKREQLRKRYNSINKQARKENVEQSQEAFELYSKAYGIVGEVLKEFYSDQLQKLLVNSKIMLQTEVINKDAVRELFESIAYNVLYNYSENFENGNKEVFKHFEKFIEETDVK